MMMLLAAVQRLLRAIPFIWAAFNRVAGTTEFLARGREKGRVSNTPLSLLRLVTRALCSTWVVRNTFVIVGGKKDWSTFPVCVVGNLTTPPVITIPNFASSSTFSQLQPLVTSMAV